MTKSMTAFTRIESGNISWEIRSVNHRYLDTTFKISERFRTLETGLRNALRNKLKRGKVDCLLRVDQAGNDAVTFNVNEQQLKKLSQAIEKVRSTTGLENPASALEILKWPGILLEVEEDRSELDQQIKSSFTDALDSLLDMRQREGEVLKRIILEKLQELEAIVQAVSNEAPGIVKRQRQRLDEKLAELEVNIDKGRLEQEIVYLAQKADITEEIDRLRTHVEEVRGTLSQPGAVGRRLDFLMQELNREANTLSSKAVAADTSIQAVELKVIIEQMREQVQNIE